MSTKSADWWTWNRSPWSGCKDLALPPDQRSPGCAKCWLPGMLTGRGGKTIHNGAKPWEIQLHPGRLAQLLKEKKPQRAGWINGEVADVATDHPEYLAACVGVALARPDHGFGVPTSDPGAVVEWAMERDQWDTVENYDGCLGRAFNVLPKEMDATGLLDQDLGSVSYPPPNWIWLLSIANQDEADERLDHGVELASIGWAWGAHCEPLTGPVVIADDALRSMAWLVVGAPKGHTPTDTPPMRERGSSGLPLGSIPPTELDWYRQIRDQCAAAGIPFWLKSPLTLDGKEHRALPEGWPK